MKNDNPLRGHTILVTRPDKTGFRILEDLGASIFMYPTIRTVLPDDYSELDRTIDNLGSYHWLVFTSVNGVRYFMARLLERGKSLDLLDGLKVCAIGPKTARAVAEYGLPVDMTPEAFNADGLISAFIQEAKAGQDSRYKTSNLLGLRILLPRAENAGDTFPERITELDGQIDCPTAYRTVNPATYDSKLANLFKSGKITITTFTSAAALRNFIEAMGDESVDMLRGTVIAAIGPVTAKAVETVGLKAKIIPKKATVEAMVDDITCFVTDKDIH
jgi:uroporphyrinogen III methyltransferase / synthase